MEEVGEEQRDYDWPTRTFLLETEICLRTPQETFVHVLRVQMGIRQFLPELVTGKGHSIFVADLDKVSEVEPISEVSLNVHYLNR